MTRRIRLITYGLVALISGLYIYICAHTPLTILADAHFDDGLFMSHGRLLASGHWLGPFSQYTLMKGPGYPAFLALSAWSGLPITITEAIFNCIAVGGICWVIWRLSGSRLLALATFVLVLWNPGLVQQRVLRDAIYPGQLLLFLGALAYALFCSTRRAQVVLWGSIAGAMLGWFWLTREEGVWILPGATLLILGGALNAWLRTRRIRLPVTAVACMSLVFILMMAAFRLGNLIAYGSFVGVDVKESNFAGALEALESVEVGRPIPFVPVTAQARRKIYEVSPAFASIGSHLDSPSSGWRNPGCEIYPWTCNEIAGGWFLWALRDAAAGEGFYQSPARAIKFFGKVRTQIDSACSDGRLVCSSSPIPLMPRISREQAWQIPASFKSALSLLLFRNHGLHPNWPSTGSAADLSEARNFLNYPLSMPLHIPPEHPSIQYQLSTFSREQQSRIGRHLGDLAMVSPADSCIGTFESASSDGYEGGAKVNGWAWSSKEKVAPSQILMADDAGIIVGLASGGFPRPDVITTLPEVTEQKTGWKGYSEEGRSVYAYAVIRGGREVCQLGGRFDVVSAPPPKDTPDSAATDSRAKLARSVRMFLDGAYGFLMPVLFWSGLLALPVSIWLMGGRRAASDPILVLAVVSWVLILSRITLLALIDVSSFPAIGPGYLAPIYALTCIAPMLSIASIIGLLRRV